MRLLVLLVVLVLVLLVLVVAEQHLTAEDLAMECHLSTPSVPATVARSHCQLLLELTHCSLTLTHSSLGLSCSSSSTGGLLRLIRRSATCTTTSAAHEG